MKVWKIHKIISEKSPSTRRDSILKTILKSRGLKTSNQIKTFLEPPHPSQLTPKAVGINLTHLKKAIARIKKAIKKKELIIVYGDYDADGVCATAILWETLHRLGANALPFIPHRQKHGYGISKKGLDDITEDHQPLIITVDNGIVAHQAINYAKNKGLDVIISDHHVAAKTLPKAHSIIHTTKLAGTGVAWIFAQEIAKSLKKSPSSNLDLAAIGTVADMVPLLSANRAIVKHGIKKLSSPKRIGLAQLFKEAGVDSGNISTYEINFVIAPRLNAMGRLGHALDSLRLLCTTSQSRASKLAISMSQTNRTRQDLTQDQLLHAKNIASTLVEKEKILIVGHESYHEGVIGLIAGRLTETYWRPSIVLSLGKKTSKASARSIPGFNIIEALRETSDLLVDVGGHPMAAGFTIENDKIDKLTEKLQTLAQKTITDKHLQKTLNIDCQINLADIDKHLFNEISRFEPFGKANPQPIFSSKSVAVIEARAVGAKNNHLKLTVSQNGQQLGGIGFWLGESAAKLNSGDSIDLAYTIDENEWNGKTELQLKIKDLHKQ